MRDLVLLMWIIGAVSNGIAFVLSWDTEFLIVSLLCLVMFHLNNGWEVEL